jgi:hypothetical protein
MKTISELNERWWYRLLKVTYVILLLSAFTLGIYGVYSSSNPVYDGNKSYIQCDNGKNFILNEHGFFVSGERLSSYMDYRAKDLCVNVTGGNQLDLNGGTSGKYDLVIFYPERDWFLVIMYSIFVLVSNYMVFEIIRRIFYYILLGSLRPKKE